jgi:hypothetical protein
MDKVEIAQIRAMLACGGLTTVELCGLCSHDRCGLVQCKVAFWDFIESPDTLSGGKWKIKEDRRVELWLKYG